MSEQYDLAVSFAGEQREYVEAVVRECQRQGLRVFYDRDKNNDWWGKNYIREQRTIYSSKTRFFVPFLSNDYLNKGVTMDEFSAAMMTSVNQGDGYILPVLMPETTVPADLLHPHIHHLRAEDYTPEELAAQFVSKVKDAENAGQVPATIGSTVERALEVRMPRVVPTNWSKYQELDRIFEHLAKRFQEGALQLTQVQMVCTVRVRDDKITVRVERGGATVAGIEVRRGTNMGDDSITWAIGTRLVSDNSWNGWASIGYDVERGTGYIDLSDPGSMMRSGRGVGHVDAEGLFAHLWDELLKQIEQ